MYKRQLSEDLNSKKTLQSEAKDILTEIKNNLQENKYRVDEAKNQINNLKHKEAKNNHTERQEEKRIQKKVDSISSLWDNFKQSNIHIIVVPEGEEKYQEIRNLCKKIMRENSDLLKEIDMQIQEAQRVLNKMDAEAHYKTHHN